MKISNFKLKILPVAIISLAAIIIHAPTPFTLIKQARAITMSNDDFIIQMSDLNTAAGDIQNNKYKMNTTTGQTAPGLYTGTNYKAKAGFEYIYPLSAFSISVSSTLIDFGELTATNPISRTTLLTVTNPPPSGYRVLAYEDHPLLALSNATIPDTSCDNGLCNETTASAWTNTLTYGLGYRCDNIERTDCAGGFTESGYFKQFADRSKNESMQTVMTGQTFTGRARSQITYKVNVSGTQVPGMYANTITYIVTPGF